LKIETQPLEENQVKIIAEFEPEVLEKYKQRAARKISQTSKIPGFRPGKAPYVVILRMVGAEAIEHEAIDLMLDDEYQNVIKEAAINPAGPGNLEEIISTDPPKFAFTVPLAPEIKLGDYHSIRKSYELPSITEDRVDQVVRNMRASYSTAEPVERPIQEGDLATLTIGGVLTHPAEGEEAQVFPESSPQMIVGENDLEVDNWPYVNFTRELIGMSANEEKEIVYTFAADDEEEKLRSKEVKFSVKITSVKFLTLPEVTDEFAQSLGDYPTVADLRTSIRKTLEDNEQREYDNKYLTSIIDDIRGMSTILYPPQVLQEEVDHVLHTLEDDLAQQQMDLSTYLKTISKEKEEFIETEAKPVARQRLERSLIMDEIARAEALQLDMDALQQEASRTMAALQNDPEYKKMAKGRKADDLARNVTMESANRVMNRQVMERLKGIASGQLDAKPEVVSAEPVTAEAAPVEPSSAPAAVETVAETSDEPLAAETESKPKKTRKKKLSTE
jgi:trigger factor